MLHTDFRENRPAGSGEEDFLSGFSHIWAWRPSWSCNPDFTNKPSFPLPIDAPHFDWPSGFRGEDFFYIQFNVSFKIISAHMKRANQ